MACAGPSRPRPWAGSGPPWAPRRGSGRPWSRTPACPRPAGLRGEGRLSLDTTPPAAARPFRYVRQDRRLVPVFERDLGETPLHGVRAPAGSWLVELAAPGHETVRCPVHIGRREHWQGVPPDDTTTARVPLPAAGSLGPDEVYVSPGWCTVGGDADAVGCGPRRAAWLDGFVIQRFPVTNRRFIAFLDDLVARGREAEALRAAPRERQAGGEDGPLVYGRDAAGRFFLRGDADGDRWAPDWPVLLVDEAGALAYAAWLSARTGPRWRLPWEAEWEKAARGVDGRLYPWGDTVDPTWARLRESAPGRHLPAPVGEPPTDESPYGVRGMAGKVMDRCADAFTQGGAAVEAGRPRWRAAGEAPGWPGVAPGPSRPTWRGSACGPPCCPGSAERPSASGSCGRSSSVDSPAGPRQAAATGPVWSPHVPRCAADRPGRVHRPEGPPGGEDGYPNLDGDDGGADVDSVAGDDSGIGGSAFDAVAEMDQDCDPDDGLPPALVVTVDGDTAHVRHGDLLLASCGTWSTGIDLDADARTVTVTYDNPDAADRTETCAWTFAYAVEALGAGDWTLTAAGDTGAFTIAESRGAPSPGWRSAAARREGGLPPGQWRVRRGVSSHTPG